MHNINSKITALGKALPVHIVTNDDLTDTLDTSDEWITERTGIKQRHISTVNTSSLCIDVAKNIIDEFGINPKSIDGIIVATFTPDYLTPSVACIVQGSIGADNAFAFDVNAACSGFVYALSIADKYIKQGYKKILVIGGEVVSKVIDENDRKTAILFGDGAGGVILEPTTDGSGILQEYIGSDGVDFNKLTANYMGVNNRLSKEDDVKGMDMDGRYIFGFATKKVPKSILNVLDKADMDVNDIDYIVPHQANIKIIKQVAKKLKIDMNKVYTNIDRVANTSAGSIPIALYDMYDEGLIKIGSNQKIVITGFGAGITWGTMLIKM